VRDQIGGPVGGSQPIQSSARRCMNDEQWRGLIEQASRSRPTAAQATTFLKTWESASRPVLLRCSDGKDYVVKGKQSGRMIVNDHVVGRLGAELGAPVGYVAVVDVPDTLIKAEPNLQHMTPGLSHATLLIPRVGERESILHVNVPENRPRFALLAILYGWVSAADHQFLYENQPPHLVHSVDHGHFFPGGPDWTTASLRGAGDPALDPTVAGACAFIAEEIATAAGALAPLPDQVVVEVVAAPPEEWGLTLEERVALAAYLAARRDRLVEVLRET
jgi:hypothetical protein